MSWILLIICPQTINHFAFMCFTSTDSSLCVFDMLLIKLNMDWWEEPPLDLRH